MVSKRALAQGDLDILCVKVEPPRDGKEILLREVRTSRQQEGMCLPELPACGSKFGKLGREIGSRMELGVGKMAPDEAKTVKAIEQRLHRSSGGEAVRTAEVAVLDQGQLGVVGADDVIVLSDRRQRARGRGGEAAPRYLARAGGHGSAEQRLGVVAKPPRVLVEEDANGVGRGPRLGRSGEAQSRARPGRATTFETPVRPRRREPGSPTGIGSTGPLSSAGTLAGVRPAERRRGASHQGQASTVGQRANVSVLKPHPEQLT